MKTLLILLWTLPAQADDAAAYGPLTERIKKGEEGALEEGLKELEKETIKYSPMLAALVTAVAESGQKTVVPRLLDVIVKTADQRLRLHLINSLIRLKDPRTMPLLMKLALEKEEAAGLASVRAALAMPGGSTVDFLKKVLACESFPRQLIAAEELLHQDITDGYPVLERIQEEGTVPERMSVVRIAASLKRKESVDLLVRALEDAEPKVGQAARPALIASLTALYPYLRFDAKASVEKIKAWWKENRVK